MNQLRIGVDRRSFLAAIGSILFGPLNNQGLAAGLVADDGSPIRLVDVAEERLQNAFAYGQHMGPESADVILAELSDYNCGFCRRAWRPLSEVMAADQRLALQFIHFPILSPGSEAAAALQQAVFHREGADVGARLHAALMAWSGRVDEVAARNACASLKISFPGSEPIERARSEISHMRRNATQLGIRFTPTFSVAGMTFVGWPGPETIKGLAAQARKCGRLPCG